VKLVLNGLPPNSAVSGNQVPWISLASSAASVVRAVTSKKVDRRRGVFIMVL
jgi:hypothetical protein